MRSDDDDALGVMFRYQDNDNYYRFSWDIQRTYRRLVKRENGLVTLLAEDREQYVPGQTYQVEIVAQGPQLEVWIDGAQIFAVTDTSFNFTGGTIALYAWGNAGSAFDDVVVEELATGTVLVADDFDDGESSGWTMVDEGTLEGPSVWSAATGTLVQSANIYSEPIDAADLAKPGTFALYTAGLWMDYRVRLTMRSDDDDALGVMFRYQDNDNYYRFSWDSQRTYRRLVKRENGLVTLLAEDREQYVPGQTYQVEIVVQGPQLEVWLDGAQIFAVTDTSFASGTIALYAWANEGSAFDDVVVEELATGTVLLADDFNDGDFNGWTALDDGIAYGPSMWSAATGTLVQSSNINTTSPDPSDIGRFGTFALYPAGGD